MIVFQVKGQSHRLSTLKGKEKDVMKNVSTYSTKYNDDTEALERQLSQARSKSDPVKYGPSVVKAVPLVAVRVFSEGRVVTRHHRPSVVGHSEETVDLRRRTVYSTDMEMRQLFTTQHNATHQMQMPDPVFEKSCAATQKNFGGFLKTLKNVVCSFRNHIITPVVNTHFTVTESQYQ